MATQADKTSRTEVAALEVRASHAGTHLLVDLWRAKRLDEPAHLERTLRDAAAACGATVLAVNVHRFGAGGGVSALALLAESHISVHTWPERGYAAADIFMCGACDPYRALPVLEAGLACEVLRVHEQKRGVVDPAVA